MKKNMLFVMLTASMIMSSLSGQNTFSISGRVVDHTNQPLPGCHVHIDSLCSISDWDGYFEISELRSGVYHMTASYIGYNDYATDIRIMEKDTILTIRINPSVTTLDELIIRDNYAINRIKEEPRNMMMADENFLKQNLGGSLMKSLEKLPGISAMSIGSGQSKPIIRGLSFNRILVLENGIKHEAQQWGADHGLEIDQFAVEQVEVIKGPASLSYGSDAIGGVLNVIQSSVPRPNSLGGGVDLIGKTNNTLLGSSVNLFGRGQDFYFKSRVTLVDYGDYKVPADSIEYNTYYFKLKDNQLRNTAGKETNLHFMGGILKGKTNSNITISNVFSKSGFFAYVHGLEIRNSQIDFDESSRDIDLPYQQVNHFKVTGRSVLFFNSGTVELNAGYQNNLRKEFSEAVSHGYMPEPPDSLERQFNKHTGTLHLTWQGQLAMHNVSAGLNTEIQHNRSGGWGFILPGFEQSTAGIFVTDRIDISEKLILSGGIRFDLGEIHVNEYYDWFLTPVMGEGDSVHHERIRRAAPLTRRFGSNSWSIGLNYNPESFLLRANIGKSFRMPTVKELAADGINYHFFRYEKGDQSLHPEVSYQFDAGWDMKRGKSEISVTPFFNYFPNYIYLNPTSEYQEGMQVYFYRESQVVRSGGELRLSHSFSRYVESSVMGEYIYSRQLTGAKKDFSLPFSPPPSVLFGIKLKPGQFKAFANSFFAVDLRVVARQNEIVPPEQKTPGYQVIHLAGGTTLQWKQQTIVVHLQVQNLFNSRYLDHISFYRPIGVPEPGRNFGIHIQIPIEPNLK